MREAYEAGLAGPGYLWFGSNELASHRLWEADDAMAMNVSLRDRTLRGFLALAPNGFREDFAGSTGYLARRDQLLPPCMLPIQALWGLI